MKAQLKRIIAIACLLACQPVIAQQGGFKATEEWRFSGLTGTNTYFASHSDPNRKEVTEESRSRLRRAMIDNSSMPILPKPVVLEDGISSETQVTVLLRDESRDDPQKPKGVASFKYRNSLGENEDAYVVWRGANTDSYIMFSDKVISIYTVHRNVAHPDGGYLLTLTQIGNAPLGVRSYSMSGSAKRVK